MPTYVYEGQADSFSYGDKTVNKADPEEKRRISMPKAVAEHMARESRLHVFREVNSGDTLEAASLAPANMTAAPAPEPAKKPQ